MADKYYHKPVLLREALEYLDPQPGGKFIDCTLGGGGYARALAQRVGDKGFVVGLDRDQSAIDHAQSEVRALGLSNIFLIKKDFRDIKKAAAEAVEGRIEGCFSGAVFDLGLSSAQLNDSGTGMSFLREGPLNMRFDRTSREESGQTAGNIVNKYPEKRLAALLREYGQEKFAGRIAKQIASERRQAPIDTTFRLVEIIRKAVPANYAHSRLHFATRTFQALRIEVNQELDSLKEALPQALELLGPGGRLVVISYHSLEDRIVKDFFKKESRDCLCPPEAPECHCGHIGQIKRLTKKVVKPSEEEIAANPRARSAKLRVAEKKR